MTCGEHVQQLLREYGIRREIRLRTRGYAWPGEGRIQTPPLRSVDAYMVTLHEIGHIALGHTLTAWKQNTLCWEAKAWEWALTHAEDTVGELGTDKLRKIVWHRRLGTYASGMYPGASSRPFRRLKQRLGYAT